MTKHKDFKRLVRSRMRKTGESYTTARTRISSKSTNPKTSAVPEAKYAEIAGMSDEAVSAKTGHTWKQWARVLDAIDATGMPHKEIAAHLHEAYGLPTWWAQTVTVGYERIRGLRDVGQRRGGAYESNKSKTLAAPVSAVYRAFATGRIRSRWLPGVTLTVRKATPEKSLRITWPDGTRVQVNLVAKGDTKTQAVVQHTMLASRAEKEKMKGFWTERLNVLSELLEGSAARGSKAE